jgi:hypothetical protein
MGITHFAADEAADEAHLSVGQLRPTAHTPQGIESLKRIPVGFVDSDKGYVSIKKKKVLLKSLLRIYKFFTRTRGLVSVILKYKYGQRRPNNYGSGSYLEIFVANRK